MIQADPFDEAESVSHSDSVAVSPSATDSRPVVGQQVLLSDDAPVVLRISKPISSAFLHQSLGHLIRKNGDIEQPETTSLPAWQLFLPCHDKCPLPLPDRCLQAIPNRHGSPRHVSQSCFSRVDYCRLFLSSAAEAVHQKEFSDVNVID